MKKIIKIKKEFLNKESLLKYGFKCSDFFNEYTYEGVEYIEIREDGTIFLLGNDYAYLDDIIYHLVIDGLIEITEIQ